MKKEYKMYRLNKNMRILPLLLLLLVIVIIVFMCFKKNVSDKSLLSETKYINVIKSVGGSDKRDLKNVITEKNEITYIIKIIENSEEVGNSHMTLEGGFACYEFNFMNDDSALIDSFKFYGGDFLMAHNKKYSISKKDKDYLETKIG